MTDQSVTPVVLFAYARPTHLTSTLEALRQDGVPLIHAFSDGPRSPEMAPAVEEVRKILRAIDWCEVRIVERETNLGLGLSIREGVGEILARYGSAIVCEDDLVCVKGTYAYLCAALARYKDDRRVMSVTGWTHPRVTPRGVKDNPYFDGRAECLMWGAWARSWEGMDRDALSLVADCRARGIDPYRYGGDLLAMADEERKRNIWAVRFLYLHMVKGGLCLRPPHSLVEHIGFDAQATNSANETRWLNPPLQPCPPIPTRWPEPRVHPACSRLWQNAQGGRPGIRSFVRRALGKARRIIEGRP